MIKKKKKKSRLAWIKSKPSLITMASILSLFGSVWAIDQRWLPREIHNIAMGQVQQSISALQKEQALSSARNEVFYWLRRENELKTMCSRSPNNPQLKADLEQTIIERRRAEDEVKRLQEKK